MSQRTLQIKALTVETQRQGQRVKLVDNLSLSVERGKVLALVGPSGSGKSLTCAASLDVLPPGTWRKAGVISIDGEVRSPSSLRGREVAVILQNPRSAFNPVRTMCSHAYETLHAIGADLPGWQERAAMAMIAAGLSEPQRIFDLYPFEMSGGMLQRMMIALALMSEAPFLFADEPTTDLDLIVQRDILDLLERLKQERGLGILLVTHDMGVVARLAEQVAVIDSGRIVEAAAVSDLFLRPVHPTTRQLIDAHLSLYGMEWAA
ncbi:ATP-binding cassette domain-containing protein [Aquamicrobium segne]|uniref:ATP-binding cassette domain-containing protein n=1 Tax=Aquamicrobium segne TaxID=469547 RepID=A0ABW0GUR4_9HYPH